MDIRCKNLFDAIPEQLENEQFIELLNTGDVLIERIVSKGHSSDWFDQQRNEWVVLLQGEAIIAFKDETEVCLKKGDFLLLPAHKKHRVKWTAPNQHSIWLAVHYL